MTLWSVLCRTLGLSTLMPASAWLNPEFYPDWPRDCIRSVDIVSGCFLLIERGLWEDLDGFDPAFFLYGEEADLCLRAMAKGAKPAVTPEATIVHLVGASQNDASARNVQLLAARIRLVRRHFPLWQRRLAIGLIRAGVILRLVGYHAIARIPGQRGRQETSLRVWRARGRWWNGYGGKDTARR